MPKDEKAEICAMAYDSVAGDRNERRPTDPLSGHENAGRRDDHRRNSAGRTAYSSAGEKRIGRVSEIQQYAEETRHQMR